MRTFLILAGVVIVLVGGFFWWSQNAAALGTLDVYAGSVTIVSGGEERPGKTGDTVRATDVLKVSADGRVGVLLGRGSIVRLEGETQADIQTIVGKAKTLTNGHILLLQGDVWSTVESGAGIDYSVETPTIVATVRGTRFNVRYRNGVSTVLVTEGRVWVRLKSGRGGEVMVEAGQYIEIRDDHAEEDLAAGPKSIGEEEKDGWVDFNEEKDAGEVVSSSVSSASSASPAPSEVEGSESLVEVASSRAPTASKAAASSRASVIAAPASSSRAAASAGGGAGATTTATLTIKADASSVLVGETLKLQAILKSDAGTSDETKTVTWSVHPFTMGTVDRLGTFHASAAGDATIDAVLRGSISNRISIRITQPTTGGGGGTTGGAAATSAAASSPAPTAVTVQSIRVSCVKSTDPQQGPPTLAQCSALAVMSDGTTQNVTTKSQWSVSGTAKGAVSPEGYYYSDAREGTDTVTATFGGTKGSTTITVP